MGQGASQAELVRMRMRGDVAGLCRATRSDDHAVAVQAIEFLGSSTGSPEAVKALFACLGRKDEPHYELRWSAAVALGRLREQRAVPELLRLLAEERRGSEPLDRPICEALAAIGGPEVVHGLLDVLDQVATHHNRYTAVLVLDALARLRPREAVTPLLVSLWHYLPDHAEHIVRTLGAIGDPRAASALLVLVHSSASDVHLRRAAVRALHALRAAAWPPGRRYPSAEEVLRETQRDPDPETGRLATALLSGTEDGREHLWGVLRAAAHSPHDAECPPHAVVAVCDRVAEAPGLFGVDAPGQDAYIALLRHHLREAAAPTVRRAAARALAACAGAGASAALLDALGDARIGDAVADLLAGLHKPPLREILALLADTDRPVSQRGNAARALGAARYAAAVPSLLAALADDTVPMAVRASVTDALGALRLLAGAAPLAALAKDEEQPSTVRARAVRALGLIGAPDTLPVVLACARSSHEAIRARAVTALGGYPMSAAARALGEVVAHDPEPDIARAAVHALGRIGFPGLLILVRLADDVQENVADQLVAALAAHPEAEATAALGRLAAAPSTQKAASAALSERGTPDCVEPLAALLDADLLPSMREAAVRGLLRIGTDEAHERVLAHCLTAAHLYGWHVEALDVIAEARGVRLGL
ncbi:HEAT repeat domain-containing protein [Streptomyces sp. NPDC093510]|uniref:HEAT repeat domain-containing protein n=1 Tax=Streptomyces sp. NPDC093510 TaxID=3155199 RepID=UPI003442BF30